MRGIDSGQKAFQVFGKTSKIKAGKNRENNAFPRVWGWGSVRGSGKEMEWKWLKLGHPGQGIRKLFWGEMSRIENIMKLKVYKVPGIFKKLKECGKSDTSQVETTKGWAPLKSTGQGQSQVIWRFGQKSEVLEFRKWPLASDWG
jgi:hypothetical protein